MFLGAFAAATGINKVWAAIPGVAAPSGTSQCGAVQQALQLGIGDYVEAIFGTRKQWLSLLTDGATQATQAALITESCSSCIVDQFRNNVPVAEQTSCGSIVSPVVECTAATASKPKVDAASALALVAAPNAMSDGESFNTFVLLTQEILNCLIITTQQKSPEAEEAPEVLAAASACAASGVSYCGPGNSGDPSNSSWGYVLKLLDPPPCLNEECCQHDNCYAKSCIPTSCYFSASVASSCDNPLIAACNGTGSCSSSELLKPSALAICAAVNCLTSGVANAAQICNFLQQGSQGICSSSNCGQSTCCASGTSCETGPTVVPHALTGVCCPPGSFPCESTCCPSGQMCSGTQCVEACTEGEVACGHFCCPPGYTCSGAQCLPYFCPPTSPVPCYSDGELTCCAPSSVCCGNQTGQAGCPPPGWFCCGPDGGVCPPDVVCCEQANQANNFGCCPQGYACVNRACVPPG